jgi:glycine cleavage system protein P-like pyridoxal-binding family
MMRYIKQLENKDLSLNTSMISLGSCTMKLNAATQMMPLSWIHWSKIHPFAPVDQTQGYQQVLDELSQYLCEITGFDACSLQPNSGAQGEYAGLLAIRNFHLANGDKQRTVILIPISAHGTNPASAVMAAMEVVVVKSDEEGKIDVADLKAKAEQYKDKLSCLMVTYPSTHGVLRLEVLMDGEIIRQVVPHIGYLHRCFEKHGENLPYNQVIPFVDRLDYVASMNSEHAYAMGVERMLGIEQQIPKRVEYIRVLVAELNRRIRVQCDAARRQ